MTIKQRLDLRQGQSLTMTPQLQQAIKLLQMSNLELSAFIEAELENNPLLERDDPAPDKTEHAAPQDPSESAEAPLDASFDNVFTGESQAERQDQETQALAAQDGEYDAFATNPFSGVGKGGGASFDDPDFGLESTLAREVNLREHLTGQIRAGFAAAQDRAIAILMIDGLDESGYFRGDLGILSDRLGCAPARVEGILARLQALDPPGIFARNLKECLALQLAEKNRLDPAMAALLDHLDLLAARDFKKLKTLCGVDEDDLRDMAAEIRALDPKPATAFDHFVAQTVVPDVFMKPLPKSRGGGFAVELNHDTLPRVLVNKTYYAEVSTSAHSREDKAYLTDRMNAAGWLVKAMDQRARTILKVAGEIVAQQEAFFNYGVEYLKPLALKDVATVVGVHESTVSRVTAGKYIGTPRGVFELKYFFSSGVGSTAGPAEFSAEAVKARIKALIDAETAETVLSDDDLADALTKEGIDIARRTVAKYREAMKIPSSVQRRRLKRGG